MTSESNNYKLSVEMVWTTHYNDWVYSLIRRDQEVVGGDSLDIKVTVTNSGDRPFNGIIQNLELVEKIENTGMYWQVKSEILDNLGPGVSKKIIEETIVPIGEGLLHLGFIIASNDGKTVYIEGRNSNDFHQFLYVVNRLLLQLVGQRK